MSGGRESGLELSDSDSRVLAENPLEVSRDVVQHTVHSTVGAMFREVRPQLELMFPVALVGRCIMNKMIDSTKHTDVGRVVERRRLRARGAPRRCGSSARG